jgi:outer membrane protein assembly factor BamB
MNIFRCGRGAVAVGLAVLVVGCGGGGGNSSPPPTNNTPTPPPPATQYTMSVSTNTVSVSAVTTDPAPTATVDISISPAVAAGTTIYIGGQYSNHGIDSVAGVQNGAVFTVTINFDTPATLGAGTYNDTVTLTACMDQACTQPINNSPQTIAVTYTVTEVPPPTLTSINPTSVVAGAAPFTLTVMGTGFDPQTVVQWNGVALPTNYAAPTQLTAQVNAANVAAAGTYQVTAGDPGGPVSNGIAFTVAPQPTLQANSIWPTSVTAGAPAFTLEVLGQAFAAGAVVQWNGSARSTTVVSSNELLAQIPASDVASVGNASVTVLNSGGSPASNALQVSIMPPSIDALSYQMNPAHTGAVSFKSISFPTSSSWSVNVGGPASYAIIVGGRVFVTVSENNNSELLALDASTGSTLWGPIALAGNANATYDAGMLFVVSGTGVNSQIISAIDPATGSSKWSSKVNGSWFPVPPVAAQGVVYTSNGGLVSAFDETSGALLWQQGASGTSGTIALSLDGVYASAPCTTNDLRPLTGAVVWSNNTGCSGGGGNTPVVADGVVYSPINAQYSGTSFDAETGKVLGNFSATDLPALTPNTGFWLTNSTLQGIERSNNQILWSFTGDGSLVTTPIVVNNYVFVGSSKGNLYALDTTSGAQVWTQKLGASMQANSEVSLSMYTGLAAGDGLLVVPAGNTVTAYTLSTNP